MTVSEVEKEAFRERRESSRSVLPAPPEEDDPAVECAACC